MKGFQSSDLPRRMFHLYEGVRSSDRSTYMKGFQSSDLPRRMFHLYEGVRSSDRSTCMKGSGAQTCPGGCSTYMKGPELRGCRAQTCPGVRSSDRSTMKGFQSSDLPRRMFHLYEGVRSSDRSTYMKGSGAQTCPGGCSTYMKGPELRPFHLYEGVPELRPAQEDVPPI